MAQLKDLLVTGPARLIGAVNFNQIPKYNNINLALITDVADVVGKSSDAAGTATVYGAIALAANANTAAGNAQSRADSAYNLADSKTTMGEVEGKGYATTTQAQEYVAVLKGKSTDASNVVTVYGARAAAAAAQSTANNAATAASNAQSTANTASGKADAAQGTANSAVSAASAAQSSANAAAAAASAAQSTADGAASAAAAANAKAESNATSISNLETNKLDNTTDTFTGTLTMNVTKNSLQSISAAGYITGSWLQHTSDFLNDADDYTVCVTNNSGWLYKKSKNKLVSDLGLSTVYKYKGSITWAGLKALESASQGDVYFITDKDAAGNSNTSWACYTAFTNSNGGTGNSYATYWSSLGGTIDFSPYAVKEASNEFKGEQQMIHSTYCPNMYDIALGVGCSLKNTRALDNQAIIGELLLPTAASNGDGTANTCQVTANEMGIYLINQVGASSNNYAKITKKTEIGRFKSTGWNGNVVGNSTTSSYPEGFSSRVTTASSWGTLTAANGYTFITGWKFDDSALNKTDTAVESADVVFAAKNKTSSNESKGEISMQIDGYFYQHEGSRRVLDTSNVTGTTNYVPKFTNTNILGNSKILDEGDATTGLVSIKSRLLVDGNGSSYNEGIRVLPASNGWSNMYFAAAKTKTIKDSEGKDVVVVNESGTEVGGWLVGRRGANGSVKIQSNVTGGTIVAKAGDFTIEENASDGTNLTIHKNTKNSDGSTTYGGATLMGPFTASQFKGDYTATSMSISDNNEISFGSNANYIYFGYDNRTGSSQRVTTYIFGQHAGSGDNANYRGNIECGTLRVNGTIEGRKGQFTYNTIDKCIDVTFS